MRRRARAALRIIHGCPTYRLGIHVEPERPATAFGIGLEECDRHDLLRPVIAGCRVDRVVAGGEAIDPLFERGKLRRSQAPCPTDPFRPAKIGIEVQLGYEALERQRVDIFGCAEQCRGSAQVSGRTVAPAFDC